MLLDKYYQNISFDFSQEDIDKRLEYLLSEEYQNGCQKIGSFAQGYRSGFLKPDEQIEFGTIGYGYVYDDVSIFNALITNILDRMEEKPGIAINNCISYAVKKTVRDYYSADKSDYPKYIKKLYDLFPGDERWKKQLDYVRECYKDLNISEMEILNQTELQVREWYPVFRDILGSDSSISAIKGLGFAKCSEFAAMSNQLFSFLGIESSYVANALDYKNNSEGHAYNVIKTEKGCFIFDSINDIVHKLENEKEAFNLMSGKINILVPKKDCIFGKASLQKNQFEMEKE